MAGRLRLRLDALAPDDDRRHARQHRGPDDLGDGAGGPEADRVARLLDPQEPDELPYQWQDCDASGGNCSAIAGATSQSYTPANGDVGHTLRVLESATASGVTSSPVTSSRPASSRRARPRAAATAAAPGGTGGGAGAARGRTGGQGGSGGTVTLSASKIRACCARCSPCTARQERFAACSNHAGYSFSFAAPSPGRLVVSWYSAPKHGKKVLVATVTLVFHRQGKATGEDRPDRKRPRTPQWHEEDEASPRRAASRLRATARSARRSRSRSTRRRGAVERRRLTTSRRRPTRGAGGEDPPPAPRVGPRRDAVRDLRPTGSSRARQGKER